MTTPRTPYPAPRPSQPGGPRLRPSDERALIAAAGRTTRRVALVALVVGLLALALTTWRTLVPASASCQQAAWDVTPATNQIPQGWVLKGATFDASGKTLSLLGPEPADTQTQQANALVTVSCYPDNAADAVTRSAASAKAAGMVVTDRTDLSDQAYVAEDSSGATFIQIRHGSVVVYIAASGDATPTEADQLASAFDRALGGDGGTIASPAPEPSALPSDAGASPGSSAQAAASPTPAAPELEKLLPTKVGTLTLEVQSAVVTEIINQLPGARAITAALRAEGKTTDDFKVAEASDGAGSQPTITIDAFAVNGMSVDKVRQLVLDSWLNASGAGVAIDSVTLAGHTFTRINYGDEGNVDYVLTGSGHVIVITTANPDLAAQAAAALP